MSFFTDERLQIFQETWKSSNGYLLNVGIGAMIDPGIQRPENLSVYPQLILATHAHYDHLAGLDSWLEDPKACFYLPAQDAWYLDSETANASKLFAHPRKFPKPDKLLEDGESVYLNDQCRLEVWLTPGHTTGSSCFILRERDDEGKEYPVAVFSGDTFFDDSIGRTDFEGGDPHKMRDTINILRTRLSMLPPELPVLPGHGRGTTVERVLKYNPFFSRGGFFSF